MVIVYRTCPRCLKRSYKRGWCFNCFYDREKDGRKSLPPETKSRTKGKVISAKVD